MMTGSIHGRFQPFHNGHLGYLRAALERTESVYIGMTRVLTEPGIGGDVAPHRLKSESNPFTYFERCQIIEAVLDREDIDPRRIRIGPFPIEEPERLAEFWPLAAPCFTTLVDDWNVRKVEVLKTLGYNVEIVEVPTSAAIRSGTLIRAAMRERDLSWRDWVPKGALHLLDDFSDRIRENEAFMG